MKLDLECVRDLMIYFENNLSYDHEIEIDEISDLNYSKDNLIYTSERLIEAGFINASSEGSILSNYPFITVYSITYSGHEFLDNIKDQSVWEKTKKTTSKFTSVSLKIVSSVASTVLSTMINQALQ